MKQSFKENLLQLRVAGREICYYVKISKFSSETELLDALAAKICNVKAIIILDNDCLTDNKFVELGQKVKLLCAEFDATLFVFNRADIAFILEADGVYLDENGISPHNAGKIISEQAIIGQQITKISEKSLHSDFVVCSNEVCLNNMRIKIIEL